MFSSSESSSYGSRFERFSGISAKSARKCCQKWSHHIYFFVSWWIFKILFSPESRAHVEYTVTVCFAWGLFQSFQLQLDLRCEIQILQLDLSLNLTGIHAASMVRHDRGELNPMETSWNFLTILKAGMRGAFFLGVKKEVRINTSKYKCDETNSQSETKCVNANLEKRLGKYLFSV